MMIKEWIAFGSILALMTFSKALAAEPVLLEEGISPQIQLEQWVQKVKAADVATPPAQTQWHALTHFQSKLWRAMALDPAPFVLVPLAQVPKNLFAAELNHELVHDWTELKKSANLNEYGAQVEFNLYARVVDEILALRNNRKFPPARAVAKRGILDNVYNALVRKVEQSATPKEGVAGHYLSPIQIQKLGAIAQAVKEQSTQIKSQERKNVFAEGGRFMWIAFIALCAFTLGVAAYRFNPNFFQQYLDSSTRINAGPEPKLDYVTWLKNFEDSLQRLKASQIIHERRIEELVVNSEKIHQHAMSLHSDARIKNEANLEHRMATLIKEIHHQIDQARKLQSADRVQIQGMLEQSLMLCDAVENQSIEIDQTKLNEPEPLYKTL